MSRLVATLRGIAYEEDGLSAVEYAVILSLIMALCIASVRTVGNRASARFTAITNSVASGSGSGRNGNSGNGGGGNKSGDNGVGITPAVNFEEAD